MKEYKINCENAEVKAEAIKLFESIGCRDFDTKDKYLDLIVHPDGEIQSVTRSDFNGNYQEKELTIEKLRKMAKPTECLVKTDNGWEYKVLPKSLIGDAVKIPKKANFAVESHRNGRDALAFYKQPNSRDYRYQGESDWCTGGRGLAGQTPIWQRTVKSKFLCLDTKNVSSVKTENSFELPDGTVKVVFSERNNNHYHAVNSSGMMWCLTSKHARWYGAGTTDYLNHNSVETVWEINPQPKSKFIVKTKLGYEVQELPKDTLVTWHCIPLVDGAPESDQTAFYELCDKVEAVDFDGAKWMRENIGSYYHLVEGCFIWGDTPQGIHYWNLISNLIK